MSKTHLIRLLLTQGREEKVIAILTRECFPNQFGQFVPPVTVEHNGIEYLMKKEWMQDVYLYQPSIRKAIDDFLIS